DGWRARGLVDNAAGAGCVPLSANASVRPYRVVRPASRSIFEFRPVERWLPSGFATAEASGCGAGFPAPRYSARARPTRLLRMGRVIVTVANHRCTATLHHPIIERCSGQQASTVAVPARARQGDER